MAYTPKYYDFLGVMITTRAYLLLRRSNVHSSDDIRALGRKHFVLEANCGRKTLIEIGSLIGEDWRNESVVPTTSVHITNMIKELETLGYQVIPPQKT
jgi:hypothetical protein